MSTSVATSAPWSRQSTNSPGTDAASTSRPKRLGVTKLSNGNEGSKKSLSPVPSTSTRSTRSRKNVSYDESNSPDLDDLPLPITTTSTPANNLPTSRKSPANGLAKHTNGFPTSSAKVASPHPSRKSPTQSPPRPEGDTGSIGEIIIARRPSSALSEAEAEAAGPKSKSITPDPVPVTGPIPEPEPVKAELPPSVQRIKLSYTPKRPASEEPDDGSAYDVTPRVSPTPDGVALGGNALNGIDSVLQAGDPNAPKRAPRKKRKWLKKGEVDPDDPIAVAKQKERFMLLDKADELLEQQMESVRNGTHPDLLALLGELDTRQSTLQQQAELRYNGAKNEIIKFGEHGRDQAQDNFVEEREHILDEKRTELNRFRHQIKYERVKFNKIPGTYSCLRDGRGSNGWFMPTSNLFSNGKERLVSFEVDGETRFRRDSALHLESMTKADAKSDLALFKRLRRQVSPGLSERRRTPTAGSSRSSRPPNVVGPLPRHIPTEMHQPHVPLRQTPNHSPSTTPAPPSRRPSPLPMTQPSVIQPREPAYTSAPFGLGHTLPRPGVARVPNPISASLSRPPSTATSALANQTGTPVPSSSTDLGTGSKLPASTSLPPAIPEPAPRFIPWWETERQKEYDNQVKEVREARERYMRDQEATRAKEADARNQDALRRLGIPTDDDWQKRNASRLASAAQPATPVTRPGDQNGGSIVTEARRQEALREMGSKKEEDWQKRLEFRWGKPRPESQSNTPVTRPPDPPAQPTVTEARKQEALREMGFKSEEEWLKRHDARSKLMDARSSTLATRPLDPLSAQPTASASTSTSASAHQIATSQSSTSNANTRPASSASASTPTTQLSSLTPRTMTESHLNRLPYQYSAAVEQELQIHRRHPDYPKKPQSTSLHRHVPYLERDAALVKMERAGIKIPRNHPDHPFNW